MVRELVALLILMLLVGLGWKQPFHEHFRNIMGGVEPASPPSRSGPPPPVVGVRPQGLVHPGVPPTPADRSWMFSRTPLDQSGADDPRGRNNAR
jgi:hypothetical protein